MLPLSRPADRSAAVSRSPRPGLKALRRACAVAAVALIPVLAGCEAGGDAPVLHWHPPTNGASATIIAGGGKIAIRNAFVLGGPLPNFTLPAGSSASMFVGLVNTGPRDRLVRVSAPGTATSVTLPTGGVLLERDSERAADRPGTQTGAQRPAPEPDQRHLRPGAAHLPERGHDTPGLYRCSPSQTRTPRSRRPPHRRPARPRRASGGITARRRPRPPRPPDPTAVPTPTPTPG